MSELASIKEVKIISVLFLIGILSLFYDQKPDLPLAYDYVTAVNYQSNQTIPKKIFITYKKIELIPNKTILNWQRLNPEYSIHVFGDAECRDTLKEIGSWAVDLFDRITQGPIRADLWRLAILFLEGGIYVDADCIPVESISQILPKDATFSIPMSMFRGGTNPIFLASTPKNPIINSMLEIYRRDIRFRKYEYWAYSVVHVAHSALAPYIDFSNRARIQRSHGQVMVILAEKSLLPHPYPWKDHTAFYYQTYLFYLRDTEEQLFLRIRDYKDTYDMYRHEFKN